MEHVKRFYELKDTPLEQASYLGQHLQAINSNIKAYLKEEDEKNKHYFYLVTFTLKNKLNAIELAKCRKYIKEQFTDRPALKVNHAILVEELTAAGTEHWHVACSTKIPLSKDRFNYYEKLYGKIDISKNKHKNINDALNYIAKTAVPEILVDFI